MSKTRKWVLERFGDLLFACVIVWVVALTIRIVLWTTDAWGVNQGARRAELSCLETHFFQGEEYFWRCDALEPIANETEAR